MPAAYTQTHRFMAVKTPLEADALLLVGFSGNEGLSQLFYFHLDLVAENGKTIAFDKLLGQPVTVRLELPNKQHRYFNGICSRLSQGESDSFFTNYRLEVVPRLWLLTRVARSRIFQQKNVPDILKEVLKGLNPTLELQGTFKPRDFCVQYRETDFNFACRLMEEEGIYYYFKHTNGNHELVLGNTPQSHADLPTGGKITYKNLSQGGAQDEDVIYDWSKTQELTSGKVTLWDHCFELPHKHLEADKTIVESVQVGQASHKLKLGENGKLEVYDWPGEYAQRFDGIAPGGGDRAGDLQNIFQDNKRTAELRMQEHAASALLVQGASNCRQLVAGHKFTVATLAGDQLTKTSQADGTYVLTGVSHAARVGSDFRSGDWSGFTYDNNFTCIPLALPFRPARTTPRPVVPGSQTAVVVGPPGEEIFTDKYGRVKVQFHWDREGKNDADSSCWVRVGTAWAGKQWGVYSIPRIGQEVIVDFLEGDPDQPIVVGSVYNADQMPAYKLPDNMTMSYVKTNTSPGGVGFNEIRFEDRKDKEQIFIHAERNLDQRVKNDSLERVIGNRHLIVGYEKDGQKGGDQREMVYQDKHLHVHRDQVEHVEGNAQFTVGKGQAESGGNLDILVEKQKTETIEGGSDLHVKQDVQEKVDGSVSLTVGADRNEKVGMNYAVEAGQVIHIKAGMTLVIEAGMQISLKVGGNFIDIGPAGIAIQGTLVMINSGGAAGSGPGAKPKEPKDAKQAAPTEPKRADDAKTGHKSAPG